VRKPAIAALVAAIAAAIVWATSSSITGQAEPWDAGGGGYYMGGLLVAGLVAGAIAPYALWAHYCGGIVGQLIYMLAFLPVGPLIGAGVFSLALFTLILLAGSFVGARVRVALR
jgi:hypothetical protein